MGPQVSLFLADSCPGDVALVPCVWAADGELARRAVVDSSPAWTQNLAPEQGRSAEAGEARCAHPCLPRRGAGTYTVSEAARFPEPTRGLLSTSELCCSRGLASFPLRGPSRSCSQYSRLLLAPTSPLCPSAAAPGVCGFPEGSGYSETLGGPSFAYFSVSLPFAPRISWALPLLE